MQRRDFLKTSSMVALGTLAIDSNLLAKENTQEKTNKLFLNPSEEALKNVSKNSFGLVYENTIAKNQKGWVNIKKVSYGIKNNKSVANLYLPVNFNAKLKYPAIVIAHPNGGVKEQVAGLFAQKLAELGYITLLLMLFIKGKVKVFHAIKIFHQVELRISLKQLIF